LTFSPSDGVSQEEVVSSHVAIFQEYCDVCGREVRGKIYARRASYDLMSCPRCGLIWANPLEFGHEFLTRRDPHHYMCEQVLLNSKDALKKRFARQLTQVMQFVDSGCPP
jgi:hypothetical protein